MTGLLNRVLHRTADKALKVTTVMEHLESQGKKIGTRQHEIAAEILRDVPGLSEEGIVVSADEIPDTISNPAPKSNVQGADKQKAFKDVIDDYNNGTEDCNKIKSQKLIDDTELDPDECVYISIDDVGVKHQKDTRKDGGSKEGKYVENTVIHVESKEGKYTITDVGMKNAFTLLVAFLVSNNLLENRLLYFFSDGAKNIKANIEEYFKPLCPYRLMLDWYHLEKRVTELLSMALKGSKEERHNIRYTLDRKLWAGNFDDAISYLQNIEKKHIKNQLRLDDAIDYLERKKENAACYALRKELGYRNSSNPAEKENDLVVANRQKHNGMSWSYAGSGALASITAMAQNEETDEWIRSAEIRFAFKKNKKQLAA